MIRCEIFSFPRNNIFASLFSHSPTFFFSSLNIEIGFFWSGRVVIVILTLSRRPHDTSCLFFLWLRKERKMRMTIVSLCFIVACVMFECHILNIMHIKSGYISVSVSCINVYMSVFPTCYSCKHVRMYVPYMF